MSSRSLTITAQFLHANAGISSMKGRVTVVLILALPLLLLCLVFPGIPDNSKQNERVNKLKLTGDLYLLYYRDHGKPPTKVEDLLVYEQDYPDGRQALQSGEVIARWGTEITPDEGLDREQVIVYERDVPTQGGWVWMSAGWGRRVSAEEFHEQIQRR